MRVVAVIGNPNRGGRTTMVAERDAARVAALGDGSIEVIELVDVASQMLGGAPHHALAVETQLRPVLVDLAAVVPTKGVYVVDSEMDRLDDQLSEWWVLAEPPLRRLLT